MEWAIHRYGEDEGAVIGAVIDLGYCLNLTDSASADILRKGYEILKLRCEMVGNKIPLIWTRPQNNAELLTINQKLEGKPLPAFGILEPIPFQIICR